MSIGRQALMDTLTEWLRPQDFQDFCPNGLQVEGRTDIARIVTGVTASQALIDRAIEHQADAILVHHGYFWKGENPSLVGMKQRRIKSLLAHDINLIAYHLPLDAHPDLGNNVGLGQALQLADLQPVEAQPPRGILYQGNNQQPVSFEQMTHRVSRAVQRELIASVCGGDHLVRKVAICTGGGQGYIEQAADIGADLFISGEISEQTVHVARERSIHYIAAGHHATERFGARALGQRLATEFSLNVEFIDIDSPA